MKYCPRCNGMGYKLVKSYPTGSHGFLETTWIKLKCCDCNGTGYVRNISTGVH